jgi:hypothetical protein
MSCFPGVQLVGIENKAGLIKTYTVVNILLDPREPKFKADAKVVKLAYLPTMLEVQRNIGVDKMSETEPNLQVKPSTCTVTLKNETWSRKGYVLQPFYAGTFYRMQGLSLDAFCINPADEKLSQSAFIVGVVRSLPAGSSALLEGAPVSAVGARCRRHSHVRAVDGEATPQLLRSGRSGCSDPVIAGEERIAEMVEQARLAHDQYRREGEIWAKSYAAGPVKQDVQVANLEAQMAVAAQGARKATLAQRLLRLDKDRSDVRSIIEAHIAALEGAIVSAANGSAEAAKTAQDLLKFVPDSAIAKNAIATHVAALQEEATNLNSRRMFADAAKTAQMLLKLAPANDIVIAICAAYRADCLTASIETILRLATRDVADTDPTELDRVRKEGKKVKTGVMDNYVGIARGRIIGNTTALICTEFFAGLQLAAKNPADFSDWMKLLIDTAQQHNIVTRQTRTIVVPELVHSGLPQAHFICWKIDLVACVITLYDSCSETSGIGENYRLLRTFAVTLTESSEVAWSLHRFPNWPKQHNGTDCGIFCLTAVLVLCCGEELNNLHPTRDSATMLPHTNRLRQRFFRELQQQQSDRTRERAMERAPWEAMENVAPTGPTVAAVPLQPSCPTQLQQVQLLGPLHPSSSNCAVLLLLLRLLLLALL